MAVIDFAWIEVDGKLMRAVEELTVTDSNEGLEEVKTLNPDRKPIGYMEGIDQHRASLKHKRTVPLEVDWRAYRRDRREFTIAYQELSGNTLGQKYQLLRCRVVSVEKGFVSSGETADQVELMALDHIDD